MERHRDDADMNFLRAVLLGSLMLIGVAANAAPAVKAFGLGDVELLDSPFKQAMERNAAYLLSLDADRLLHNTRKYAGLQPKGELYGGWESQGIAGHTLGHYLTALSQQYAATHDQRFKKRLDYIIGEMTEAQQAYGDGYVGALPELEIETLRGFKQGKVEIKDHFFFKNGAWVPWYTQHKVLAGLRDAWTLGESAQAKDVTLKLANFVADVTAGLSPQQQQIMLEVEHGGMREVLFDIYGLTQDDRYLKVAQRFEHRAILDPLLAGRDELPGKHANTQIPKVIGAARGYEVADQSEGRSIAENFWKAVVRNHSWAIGGNSDGEFFFPPASASEHLSAATAETCNTYNMLRLTERLFGWQPQVEYADFEERALYNHILASQEPKQGMFTYFMSLQPGHFKTFSTPHDSFWCCVGSGMENHTKYGAAIYFHASDAVYVNLFIPSVLRWEERGLELQQRTAYPVENRTSLTVSKAPAAALALRVRVPSWATGAATLALNGKKVAVEAKPGSYATVQRQWKQGDVLDVTIPMSVRTESLHGTTDQFAFVYGPVVLAGDLGPAPLSETVPYAKEQAANLKVEPVVVPMLAGDSQQLAAGLRRVPGALAFTLITDSPRQEITLRPFHELDYQRYTVYWKTTPAKQATNR
ncbi:glycoside hydrolase family 127 protein [Steroidobacter sp.]|uniref:glycoside hydrolase family 127 protein n=1 Tax=Steroidobacter sp. TaxID=1978227 RepID=UPI001A4374C3|nr:glycoside hydrolase family 127 protein [Steroidobacter sp.]MBL8266590.1 glycoside hydrolase family 127 protein [Steroidobacter sp.]